MGQTEVNQKEDKLSNALKKQDKHRSDLKWGEQRSEHKFTRTRSSQQQQKTKNRYKEITESTTSPETVQIQKFTQNGMNTEVHQTESLSKRGQTQKCTVNRIKTEVT